MDQKHSEECPVRNQLNLLENDQQPAMITGSLNSRKRPEGCVDVRKSNTRFGWEAACRRSARTGQDRDPGLPTVIAELDLRNPLTEDPFRHSQLSGNGSTPGTEMHRRFRPSANSVESPHSYPAASPAEILEKITRGPEWPRLTAIAIRQLVPDDSPGTRIADLTQKRFGWNPVKLSTGRAEGIES